MTDPTTTNPMANPTTDLSMGNRMSDAFQDDGLDVPVALMADDFGLAERLRELPDLDAPADDAAVDEACLTRIETTLDEAEMAVSMLDSATNGATIEVPTSDDATATAVLLSVVMPVYNEQSTIREIVRQVQAVDVNLELVIVDDFSVDGTRSILMDLEAEYDNVRVILHGYNRGKGAALRTGFEQVRGDIVLIQDADLEYDPTDYSALIAPILAGDVDVVYGSRFLGDEVRDPSFLHRLGNRLLTWASNRMTGQRLTDMETCYKVFRRRVLVDISLEQDRFGFEPEITAKLSRRGYLIREVPIAYNGRDYAEGKKIGYRDAVSALWCILRYRLRG